MNNPMQHHLGGNECYLTGNFLHAIHPNNEIGRRLGGCMRIKDMVHFYTVNSSCPKQPCETFGVGLLVLPSFLTASTLLGFFELESFAIPGHSEVCALADMVAAIYCSYA